MIKRYRDAMTHDALLTNRQGLSSKIFFFPVYKWSILCVYSLANLIYYYLQQCHSVDTFPQQTTFTY